jgi:hypothetical protein
VHDADPVRVIERIAYLERVSAEERRRRADRAPALDPASPSTNSADQRVGSVFGHESNTVAMFGWLRRDSEAR